MFEVLRKLLQGCGIVWPVIIASSIGAVVNAASCYFTMHVLHWGLIGAAVSVGLYQWSMFLSLVLIFHLQIRFSRYIVLLLLFSVGRLVFMTLYDAAVECVGKGMIIMSSISIRPIS
jgi:Na+-driven multidrug efflux pump